MNDFSAKEWFISEIGTLTKLVLPELVARTSHVDITAKHEHRALVNHGRV